MTAICLSRIITIALPFRLGSHANIHLDALRRTALPACILSPLFYFPNTSQATYTRAMPSKGMSNIIDTGKGVLKMKHVLTAVMLVGIAIGHAPIAEAQSQAPDPQSSLKSASPATDLPTLPPAPHGKSTVLGGEIRSVDPVRDQIVLKIFGQRQVKILFDERTQIFRDGSRISLRDLGPSDHASVQTLLDGTDVYALSIHLLSQSPDGEYEGRVLNYNPGIRELTVGSALFRDPVKLLVPVDTPVTRVGQPVFTRAQSGSSDLVKGALISVRFQSDRQGRSVVNQISVLATPGSEFVFVGNLSALDMRSGMLALVDPSDQKTYQIAFSSSRLLVTRNLHTGDHVIVTADFDGAHYVASAITIND
jgi:hypothetical protein